MCALIDTGQTDVAQILARLLLDRSELTLPLRNEIETLLATPIVPWRAEIDQYIRRQMPFQLTYRDAADRPWTFTIRHARIAFREKRQYLECWCEETEGNQDVPELQHNWNLRLDRISSAAITSVQGQWHPMLDEIEVELHLLKGLAFAYEAKTEDITNDWLTDSNPPIRRVVRKISNTFWFFREGLRYGEDCVIVSPESIRERFKQKVRSLYKHYEPYPTSQ